MDTKTPKPKVRPPTPFVARIAIFMLAFFIYLIIFEPLIQDTSLMQPLQMAEANIVMNLQRLFGTDVYAANSLLYYPKIGLTLYVGPICTAVREMAILTMLIMFFPGASRRARELGILMFVPLIFFENILRIAILHPLAEAYGVGGMFQIHDVFWVHGQILFLTGLILIWFYFFIFRDILKKEQNIKKKTKKKGKT
ncbi:MAG: exosortase/archaeosortase family protein [Candidatus Altiarchaeota archaeon]|nr:exosortase/archaeosortase family protein [Candidatus Altiarchaeota archaeon]